MGRKLFEPEIKIKAVQEYLDGIASQGTISDRLGISLASFQMWIDYSDALKAPDRCFGNHLSGQRKSSFRK